MGQKMVTGYTPENAVAHIFADDDAQMHRGIFAASGILESDKMLALTKVDNKTVRLLSGMYCNQGFLCCVPHNEVEDFTLVNGTVGAYRKDVLISEFKRGGGSTPDAHTFKVLTGVEAASLASAKDPVLTQNDLTTGGVHRQEALYRITLFGVQIVTIERVCNVVAAHGQMPYVSLGAVSGPVTLNTNTIYHLQLAGATTFALPTPTPGCQDQILIYLSTNGSAASWPADCIFVLGLKPLLRVGKYYRIVCEYDPNAGLWCVGAIESEAAKA